MYEKAWEVSGQRYARAQRSLGRMYIGKRDMIKAADAYAKSLKANQLNHASWFALGCCLLELAQFEKAAEAFSRTVQLEETDAEAWSNLAAALLKNQVPTANDQPAAPAVELAEDEDESMAPQPKKVDPQQNKKDALRALKRAATLKHDSHRIWENLLIVAASLSPPDYDTVLTAQRHIIDLRSKTNGESCIDVEIMEHMIRHVIALNDEFDPTKPGFERLLVEMFDKKIVPLITSSRELWQLYAKLCLWRKKPATALDANEKAWRAVTSQPGWETESEARWNVIVDATIELCDAYESLGQMEKTEGMAAGSGALVAKDWKFKARSAIRSIMGKGKDCWEDTDGWERLKEALDGLRG
ncbi:TPR-like protein, partial [Aureobasidium melanogenum]